MNALSELLNLPDSEKKTLGLVHTPAEIAQQPDTWQSTFDLFKKKRESIRTFLTSAGLAVDPSIRPTVFLVGAGTHPGAGLPGVLSSARVLDKVAPHASVFV